MKKLSRIKLSEKLEKLDQLSRNDMNSSKGGCKVYYPDHKNPIVMMDINPHKGPNSISYHIPI